jgi:hypothetical protein
MAIDCIKPAIAATHDNTREAKFKTYRIDDHSKCTTAAEAIRNASIRVRQSFATKEMGLIAPFLKTTIDHYGWTANALMVVISSS